MSIRGEHRKYEIAAVAIRLFHERGYDSVTVEDIAGAAGIGTRTFFRYFPTKENAAFPDHEERVERFRSALQARTGAADPVDAVIEVGSTNAQEYFDQPELYRPRYLLVHNEAALRDHERIADRAYELAVEEYLVKEMRDRPDIGLVAPIVASGMVAGVNQVLDIWALDETADSAALLRTTEAVMRRLAHAALAASGPSPSTDLSRHDTGDGLILVLSDDPDLRRQVTQLVERRGAGDH
jgi:AcrR family transcriptional regulator